MVLVYCSDLRCVKKSASTEKDKPLNNGNLKNIHYETDLSKVLPKNFPSTPLWGPMPNFISK